MIDAVVNVTHSFASYTHSNISSLWQFGDSNRGVLIRVNLSSVDFSPSDSELLPFLCAQGLCLVMDVKERSSFHLVSLCAHKYTDLYTEREREIFACSIRFVRLRILSQVKQPIHFTFSKSISLPRWIHRCTHACMHAYINAGQYNCATCQCTNAWRCCLLVYRAVCLDQVYTVGFNQASLIDSKPIVRWSSSLLNAWRENIDVLH